MAIAFDSVASSGTAGFKQVVSWAHTVVSNTNGAMIVFASDNGTSNVTSLKFAGNPLTKIIAGTSSGNPTGEMWYMVNPPIGLGTFNGTWSVMNNDDKSVVSMAYTGVNSATPIAGSVSILGTSVNSGSVTRTIGLNNLFVGGITLSGRPGTTSVGNERGTFSPDTAQEVLGADSTGGTIRWTHPVNNFVAQGIELNNSNGVGTNLIQSAGSSALAATSIAASWGGATTTGNMVVVGVSLTNAAVLGTVTSVADTQGNAYTRAARIAGTDLKVINSELWYATNIIGGAGSVIVNNTLDNIAIYAREYSGGYNYLDAVGSAVGSSTTPNAGTTGVPLQANELVIVTSADENGATQTYTAAANFGDMVGTTTTATGVSMSDNIINTGGAQTGTLTLGNTAGWASVCATFQRQANPRYTPQGMGGM